VIFSNCCVLRSALVEACILWQHSICFLCHITNSIVIIITTTEINTPDCSAITCWAVSSPRRPVPVEMSRDIRCLRRRDSDRRMSCSYDRPLRQSTPATRPTDTAPSTWSMSARRNPEKCSSLQWSPVNQYITPSTKVSNNKLSDSVQRRLQINEVTLNKKTSTSCLHFGILKPVTSDSSPQFHWQWFVKF